MKLQFRYLRRYLSATLIVAMFVTFAPVSAPAYASPLLEPATITHRVLVRFISPASAQSLSPSLGARNHLPNSNTRVLEIRAHSSNAALTKARMLPGVSDVEIDARVRLAFTPNDAFYTTDPWGGSGQWPLRITKTNLAWDTQRGASNIIVAVIDTGADYNHPDLSGALLPGRVILSGPDSSCPTSASAQDDDGHGTHAAGVIAANGNNGQGIAGVAFGVKVVPFKVLDCTGSGYVSDIASAITQATDAGIKIINLSLGTDSDSFTLQSAVNYATSRGTLVVAAAGNCGQVSSSCSVANPTNYPAAYEGVLAVGATDVNDAPSSFSSAANYVGVAAPGSRVLSTYLLSKPSSVPGYALMSGTSMAAPHVAGLAALLLSKNPALTPAQLRSYITSNSDDVSTPGFDTKTGHGRMNSQRTLAAAGSSVATPAPTPAPIVAPQPTATPPPTASPQPTATPRPTLQPTTPAPTPTPSPACTSTIGPGIPPPAQVPSGQSGFHASWYGQSGYMTLCPGQLATATVAYINTGSRGWVLGRMGEVAYLGTWGPSPGQDRNSSLGGDGSSGSPSTNWPRHNRMAVQPSSYVGPNQVSWFQFTVQAPLTPGTYRLDLRPLVEGSSWMEDYGVFWIVTVK